MRLLSLLTTTARRGRSALALGSLALFSGCDLNFWKMDGPQSTIEVAGPVAREQLKIFYVTCWVTLVIFIIVGAVLAYATIKFKARSAADEHAEPPPQGHGNPLIELGLIGASVLALVIIAIPTLKGIWFTHDVPEEEKANAYTVTATAYQWWFRFDYPNEQIEGVGPLNTSNELVIPANRPVRIDLRTVDVIHSFWVPKLAGKVDMIPNRGNFLWLKADEPGYYWGQCAEYCGDSHAVMRFRVIALGPKDFNDWLNRQMAPARTVAAPQAKAQFASYTFKTDWKRNEYGYSGKLDANPLQAWHDKQQPEPNEDPALIAEGRATFKAKNCITCHTIRGHEGIGTNAPNLTHVGSRTTIAGGLLENNHDQLARWISHPDEVKPGNHMYGGIGAMTGYVTKDRYGKVLQTHISLQPDEVTALVAYLQSLK
jgi:cytochrome c oxidase subunit 2